MRKVIVITGATGGIGREVAYRFAREKNILVIAYYKDKDLAEEIIQKCLAQGAEGAVAFPLELESSDSIKSFVGEVTSHFKKIDILINAAGVLGEKFLADEPEELIDQIIDVNFRGLVKITKFFLPYVKQSIVNIGSALGLYGRKNRIVYSGTKFAVRGFTQGLAGEVPHLLVYAVNPGLTATRMGNFQGMAPAKVAEIIWTAAAGKYRAKSGSDINVKEYIYGENWKYPLRAVRALKKLLA